MILNITQLYIRKPYFRTLLYRNKYNLLCTIYLYSSSHYVIYIKDASPQTNYLNMKQILMKNIQWNLVFK